MTTNIHIFSETRQPNGKWKADTADTFLKDPPNRFGWVNAQMLGVPCPRDFALFGLLCDEVRTSWPWSFVERGLPRDVSAEVAAVSKSWGVDGYGHSHISLRELHEKCMELSLYTSKEAREVRALLLKLVEQLEKVPALAMDGWVECEGTEPEDDRRVVFWFDN